MDRFRIEAKWAAIFSLMFLGWMALERSLGLHDARIALQPLVGPLILIPSALAYVLAQLDKRQALGGYMSYGQGVGSGIILTALVVLLCPVNYLIFTAVISPSYFANAARHAVQSGALTGAGAAAQFSLKNFILSGVVGGTVTGTVFSIVTAIFTRKTQK